MEWEYIEADVRLFTKKRSFPFPKNHLPLPGTVRFISYKKPPEIRQPEQRQEKVSGGVKKVNKS